jgi:hypothetical protein
MSVSFGLDAARAISTSSATTAASSSSFLTTRSPSGSPEGDSAYHAGRPFTSLRYRKTRERKDGSTAPARAAFVIHCPVKTVPATLASVGVCQGEGGREREQDTEREPNHARGHERSLIDEIAKL